MARAEPRRSAGGSALKVVVSITLLALLAFGVLVTVLHHDQAAKRGDEILYDDFGFRVLDVRRVDAIGTVVVAAGRALIVVRVQVENHARRVDYDLATHRFRLEDIGGNPIPSEDVWSKALALETRAAPPPKVLHPGESFTSDVVFEVPAHSSDLRLRVTWGGDALEAAAEIVSGDRYFVLDP